MEIVGFRGPKSNYGTVGPCYDNTVVPGRRSAKTEKTENWHGGAVPCGTVVPLGTVLPRMVLSVPIVAARVCHEVQFLLAARFRL